MNVSALACRAGDACGPASAASSGGVAEILMIAPSRYEGGKVAVFRVGIGPNGALGALAGLAEDYNRRHAPSSRIEYELFDEHVRKPVTARLLRRWHKQARRRGNRFVVMVCGIQTATYPRGRDIALMARREGIEVIAGGVHLSGHGPSVDFLLSCGVHVAVGEIEPIWDEIVADILDARLQPLYRLLPEHGLQVKTATSSVTVPDIRRVPYPHIPGRHRRRYINPSQLYIDSSRGCPFLCTFCVVKNVFGRTVRSRDPVDLVRWMMARVDQDGVHAFWFTDDNFVRNPRHMELLELLAGERRQRRFSIALILDVESTCYAGERSPRGEQTREFLRLCEAAGVSHVFMGLESTNDAALREMRKGVNRDRAEIHGSGSTDLERARARLVRRYAAAVRAWHDIGATVECGYILGFDADRPGVGLQAARDMIEIDVDIPIFYLLSPLPGSEDYAEAVRKQTLLEKDFNEYFRNRAIRAHPAMSAADLEREAFQAATEFWAWPHLLRRVLRRVIGIGGRRSLTPWHALKRQLGCKLMVRAGMLMYVEGGLFRRRWMRGGRRRAVTDQEAREYYLNGLRVGAPSSRPVSSADAGVETLPVDPGWEPGAALAAAAWRGTALTAAAADGNV